MDELLAGLREALITTIVGIVAGTWWIVRKLLSHEAQFTQVKEEHRATIRLVQQEIAHNREITNEIRDDVKSLVRHRSSHGTD